MISIRIESDKELKEESKVKIKNILENSLDIQTDLSNAFPKGFTKFDFSRFCLTLGKGSRLISFIEIKSFQPDIIKHYNYGVIYNTRLVEDY